MFLCIKMNQADITQKFQAIKALFKSTRDTLSPFT